MAGPSPACLLSSSPIWIAESLQTPPGPLRCLAWPGVCSSFTIDPTPNNLTKRRLQEAGRWALGLFFSSSQPWRLVPGGHVRGVSSVNGFSMLPWLDGSTTPARPRRPLHLGLACAKDASGFRAAGSQWGLQQCPSIPPFGQQLQHSSQLRDVMDRPIMPSASWGDGSLA
ncbi:hypothetical protein GGTG_06113 [Gaeumannomyces tritici R3-111a-1]|uniref:Uncharacterized protein n=1 Tax=Gaeumannomyces tritici (strain R3-111a-1) TaxID=644352 RepID=J3NXV8_GAET3|nr:hypothetical protein GGTG_06113 [Gaeumannomyces tritici R3-111a-1]EJT76191.1 hypothetical protein GGTG_06113 [Gaeumannomyces tritici R3-111a-1]